MSRIIYLNGAFLPESEAKISVLDRGFLFADGIYEVWAIMEGKLVDFDSHLSRLERSTHEIELPFPLLPDRLLDIQRRLIADNAVQEGLLYLQVTRGVAERDFSFPPEAVPSLLMFTQTKTLVDTVNGTKGIAVRTVPDVRWGRCDIKSIALLAQVLAKQAATKAACQEAWMVRDGLVTEGGASSAFIVSNSTVVTRPLSPAILPGCTRKAILALAAEEHITIEERPFTPDEACNAAEAFMTSASAFVTPIIAIDGKIISTGKPGPVATRLRQLYIDFARSSTLSLKEK